MFEKILMVVNASKNAYYRETRAHLKAHASDEHYLQHYTYSQ